MVMWGDLASPLNKIEHQSDSIILKPLWIWAALILDKYVLTLDIIRPQFNAFVNVSLSIGCTSETICELESKGLHVPAYLAG